MPRPSGPPRCAGAWLGEQQVGGVRVHSQLVAAQTGSLVGMGKWTNEASHVGQPRRQEGNVCPERPASHDEEGVLLGDIGGRRDNSRRRDRRDASKIRWQSPLTTSR